MTIRTLVGRSLRFYWRTHLGVLAGTCVSCAILTGALVVGDCERFTLRQIAQARLGATQMALATQDRLFRAALAGELEQDLNATTAPALSLRGSAALPDGRARANDVQVLGVDERFWKLGARRNLLSGAASDEVVLNARLARQLGVQVNDTVVLRVEQPSLLSRDAPLSGRSDASVALRGRVRAIADDADFGRFSLQANQVPPSTAFISLAALQQQIKSPGQANLLLTSAGTNANTILLRRWTLADAGLQVRDLPASGQVELRTDRVFLEPAVAQGALALSSNAAGVLSYFVNEFRLGEHATPYSFVTAAGRSLRDNEITINSWLAEDLSAKIGDELTLRYFIIGERRQLIEQTAQFRVAGIEQLKPDSSWMPDFPGLADVSNCREWEPGTPIDTGRIRSKDEDYWNKYRGTPKAFMNLSAGQRLWSNRFGNLTAVRYPAGAPVEAELRQTLDPAALGLFFAPVRSQALEASRQSLDFGGLFVGFSFFLIVAALLLSAMLYVFNLEQRREETGLLRALGFPPRRVQLILLLEGSLLALAGTALGVVAGVLYTKLTLHGLSTVWQKASGLNEFEYHAEPGTLFLGAGLSLIAIFGAMWLVQRRQALCAPVELLVGEAGMESESMREPRRWGGWLGAIALLAALATLFSTGPGTNPEIFFSAGALVLLAGVGFSQQLLSSLTRTRNVAQSLGSLGRRSAARRRGRSLTTVGVLASGVFLVVAVGAFRQNPQKAARQRHSGTGGFELYARSALPIYDDLNSPAVQEAFNLPADIMKGVSVLPLRVREGDDASCLNLNRALQPRLLGVVPEELEHRQAFAFLSPGGRWGLLSQPDPDGAVPAIGDEQTIKWALGKKVGDTLAYTDEHGRKFNVRLVAVMANSILQGSLLISAGQFTARFPDTAGYRMFLVDGPGERSAQIAEALSHGLQDRGLEVIPAWHRLAEFLEVENTYLAIFQALGWLGLMLGSAGLGIVVARNILERRGELALLQAVGFSRRALRRTIVSEHWLLIFLGLTVGLVSAGLAIVPALLSPGTEVPAVSVVLTVAGLGLGGMSWTVLAAWVALRGPLLHALRNE